MAGTRRTIIESNLYADSKDSLPISCQRLDEILDGVLWHLARKPELFPRIPGTVVHRVRTESFPETPVFLVWYTFDQDTVTLQLIEHWTEE